MRVVGIVATMFTSQARARVLACVLAGAWHEYHAVDVATRVGALSLDKLPRLAALGLIASKFPTTWQATLSGDERKAHEIQRQSSPERDDP